MIASVLLAMMYWHFLFILASICYQFIVINSFHYPHYCYRPLISNSIHKLSAPQLINKWRILASGVRSDFETEETATAETNTQANEYRVNSDEEEDIQIAEGIPIINPNSTEAAIEIDPIEVATRKKEFELELKVLDLEKNLRSERLRLQRLRDRVSDSGKMGFFLVKAQVADFQVRYLKSLF